MTKEENPERPLSDKGKQDVQRLASFLARSSRGIARYLHSGKPRAWQTADLLAQVLTPGIVTEEALGLNPNDLTDPVFEAIAQWTQGAEGNDNADVMLVGHLPHMGKLASRLVTGAEDQAVIAFTPGSVACLERTEGNNSIGGGWAVAWVVRPQLLGG